MAVTEPKPPLDQLEDLLGWLLVNRTAPVLDPAPVQEGPTVNKLLQRLVAGTQRRQSAAVSSPKPVEFRSYLSIQQRSGTQIPQRPVRRDRDGVGCFSYGRLGHTATR